MFMRMKLKNKGLEDELEDQNNEIGILKSNLSREQEKEIHEKLGFCLFELQKYLQKFNITSVTTMGSYSVSHRKLKHYILQHITLSMRKRQEILLNG